jgi:hypothetical protein
LEMGSSRPASNFNLPIPASQVATIVGVSHQGLHDDVLFWLIPEATKKLWK